MKTCIQCIRNIMGNICNLNKTKEYLLNILIKSHTKYLNKVPMLLILLILSVLNKNKIKTGIIFMQWNVKTCNLS